MRIVENELSRSGWIIYECPVGEKASPPCRDIGVSTFYSDGKACFRNSSPAGFHLLTS